MAGFTVLFWRLEWKKSTPGLSRARRTEAIRGGGPFSAARALARAGDLGVIGLVMIHHPMLFSGLAQIQTDRGNLG